MKCKTRSTLTVLLACTLLGMSGTAVCAPVHLRVNARVNPMGIDTSKPVFSWQSDAKERNWKQTAYELMVASSAALLAQGKADVWDSGKIVSSESVDIAYGGPALMSRQHCVWAVRVWSAAGDDATSSGPASFEMGLLSPTDWKAAWISHEDEAQKAALARMHWIWFAGADAMHVPGGTAGDFRYRLHLGAVPAAATLHVLNTDAYTVTVNGVTTGHKSEWSSFDYENIRAQLKTGDNEIVVHVMVPKTQRAGMNFEGKFAAALYMETSSGHGAWRVTDKGWSARSEANGAWIPVQQLGPLGEFQHVRGGDVTVEAAPDRIVSNASLLRKDFAVRGQVVSARLYITAMGAYEAYLNGQKIGGDRLTPGFTDFRRRVEYQTYDVTGSLQQGKNTLGAVLGPGWHSSPLLWSGVRRFKGPDALRAQLDVTFADGTHQVVATDASWKAAAAATTSAEIYGGEAFDARLYDAAWSTSGFRVSKLRTVALATISPDVMVTAEPDAPIEARQTIAPVSVAMVASAPVPTAVFDMGQNMVGVARLHVVGPRGATVRLRFAERLNDDGSIYTENLRDADATDYYTLSGNGSEVWAPSFTFHGFRYVEVTGYPGTPTTASLEGEVWNSLPAQPAMRLETSSTLVNKMYELGLWGQRGNFVSIPTDCPQRDERMGWMGDAGAFWRTGSYNFDIDAFSNKFMLDVTDAQKGDGAFSNISPDLLTEMARVPGAPGWGDAGVLVPYATWLQYGNRSLVEQSWPAMQRWIDFIAQTNPNYLRQKDLGSNYGDWLAPDPHTPKDLVGTAYWALIAEQMHVMATALGKAADAAKYAALYEHIRAAYQAQYIAADGTMPGDTQTDYVVTLAAGLAPQAMAQGMAARLVQNIADHQNHLTTGFLGTPYLLTVLDNSGHSDVAYALLQSDTYPSWGYMVAKGATTWWERWNGDTGDPAMNSYNHYAFGSVMAWVYRRVAGIDADPSAAGYKHIIVAPQVSSVMGEKLTHAHAEYDSVYGTIVTDWTRGADGTLTLHVRVPANAMATVLVPGTQAMMDGNAMTLTDERGVSKAVVGSGEYVFTSKL